MQDNPFVEIAQRLNRIEHCLLDLLQHSNDEKNIIEKSSYPLTVKEASKFLSLAIPTIYTLVSKGKLPFMKRGKRLYFSREELSKYLQQGKKLTAPEIAEDASLYLAKRKGGARYE